MSSEAPFDFAVAGNSAFAALLALALARCSDARICLIGQTPVPTQVNGDLALSPCPTSRPETLQRALAGVADLRALLAGHGEPLFRRANVTFAALTDKGQAAAGHARHLLSSFGIVTALLPETSSHAGFTAEGIWILQTGALFAGLAARLEAAGVVVAGRITNLQVGQESVTFGHGAARAAAKVLIVTDGEVDDALGVLPDSVATGMRTAVLTDPVPASAGRIVLDVETGGYMTGRSDGRVEALTPGGDTAEIAEWLGTFLPQDTQTRIIATSRRKVLLSRDGAALIAPLPQQAATLAIGFGASGAFLAPALARFLTNTATADEAAWLRAHDAETGRTEVADIGMIGGGRP